MDTTRRDKWKWGTYLGFTLLSVVILLCDQRSDSTLRNLALGSLASLIVVLVADMAVTMNRMWLFLVCKLWYRRQQIRVSIAYLIRIKLDDKYLLIFCKRFQHFQPIGGVFKRLAGASVLFERLGVHDDDKMPIDEETVGDLRVRVPGQRLTEFLAWYDSAQDREIGPWREFFQEVVLPKLVRSSDFPFLLFRWVRRYSTGIQFSPFFQCYEFKIAEIFEPVLNKEQEQCLREAASRHPRQLRLAEEQEMRRRGVSLADQAADISETAEWLLD